MKRVTSAEFQKNFGSFKRVALSEPISICIHGKDTLVVMSHDQFERLTRAERQAPAAASVVTDDIADLEIIATAGYDDLKAPTSV